MTTLVGFDDTRKRKRELDGDVTEERSSKRWYRPTMDSIIGSIRRLFVLGTPTKAIHDPKQNDESTKPIPQRHLKNKSLMPGSFPDQAQHAHGTRNLKASQSGAAPSQRSNGHNRNSRVYWGKIGNEISPRPHVASHLDPKFYNLAIPNPHPKPTALARRTPTKSRKNVSFRSAAKSQSRHHVQPRYAQESVLLKSSQSSDPESDKLPEELTEALRQIAVDPEGDDILRSLPESFQRSHKLQAKSEKLKARAISPALTAELKKAFETYQQNKAQEEKDKLRPKTPEKPQPLINPLPAETLNSLPNLSKLASHQQLGMFGRTPVTARDLLTLRTGVWLNDEVINSWLWELCDKAKATLSKDMEAKGTTIKDDIPRYHAFNTQWYPTMEGSDWRNKVPRWAKRAKVDGTNLLKVHKIFIPIHQGAHWTLIVILPQRKIVRYYNSMSGSASPYLQAAKDWISHELGSKWIESEWHFERADSGQQVNMSDCGVFTSLNALASFYSDANPEILPTGELTDGRNLMKFILINGGFKDDYELSKLHPDFRLEEDQQVNGEVRKVEKGKEKAH